MRRSNLEYCCVACESAGGQISLRLESRHIFMRPLTYTVQECLEEFCGEVGWKYILHHGRLSMSEREYYPVIVELQEYEDARATIVRYVRGRRI